MTKKVRVGHKYRYNPVLFDRGICSPYGAQINQLIEGDIVTVVNKYGCPRANIMGMCYIEKDGKFMGMVCTNSLEDLK